MAEPTQEGGEQRTRVPSDKERLEALPIPDLITEVVYRAKRWGADEKTPGLASRTGGLNQSKQEAELAENVLRARCT